MQPISPEIAQQLNLPEDAEGLVVTKVDATSEAYTKGLREGDVITLDCENGRVLAGEARVAVERPTEWLEEAARWRA